MAAKPRLSLIVITRNESARLQRCLQSAGFADEVIVVDHGSSDGTAALARALGARVIETADWPGFGLQKNRALAAATGDWVLSLDADEWLSDELAEAIRRVIAQDQSSFKAYELPRLSSFCGRWMRHSGWYPDPVARLFARGSGRFSDDLVHERLVVDGTIGRLTGHLLHESMATLEVAIDKMNRYSTGRAIDLRQRGRSGGLGKALGHGLWAFVRTYFLKRGFLDGRMGFVLAVNNAEVSYYRYLKIWLSEPARQTLP